MKTIVTGYAAIKIASIANYDGAPNLLNKYADPIEGERLRLTLKQAYEIASEDPSLIWMDTTSLRHNAAVAGDDVFVSTIDGGLI